MKVIQKVTELEIGKWYYLFDKRYNSFYGIEKLEWGGTSCLRNQYDEG